MTVEGLLAAPVHLVAMAAMAVFLAGVLPWAKARLAGRAGPSIRQPWRDWRRLLRKRPVVTEGRSSLLIWAPAASLAATGLAALIVPSFTLGMATAPMADLLVIAGLMALSRTVMALAAIDAGTAPAGVSAVRSMRLGALAEPALWLMMLTVALLTGTTNLDAAVVSLREMVTPGLPLLLAIAGLAGLVVVIEADPDAVAAEASGWHEAALQATAALRRVVWLSLVAALLLPGGIALAGAGLVEWPIGLAAWVVKLAVLAAASTAAATALQRAGQSAVGPVLGAAALLGLLAALFLFAGQGLT